jgi:bifunctional non-homologous end joining protein LigD
MSRAPNRETDTDLPFIKPCLAQAASEPPSGEEWVHEIKYDGYRVQIHVVAAKVMLFTRTGLDWTRKFGMVVAELEALPVRAAIIDGEAVVENEMGISEFHALERELKKGAAGRILLRAFDLLHLDGDDVRRRPLLERKAMLKTALGERRTSSLLQVSDHMQADGKEVLAGACQLGLEGIVSKRIDRPYRSGRSADWLKAKCLLADAFVVVGYVTSKPASESIGSLALGYYKGRSLIHAGRVGTGFSADQASAIWEALQTIRTEASPLSHALTREQREGIIWVRPALVAQVEYRGWTPDGVLRHSSFKAFRHDKRPATIRSPASLVGRGGH